MSGLGDMWVAVALLCGAASSDDMTKLYELDSRRNDLFGAAVGVTNDAIIVGALGGDAVYVYDAETCELGQRLAPRHALEFGRTIAIHENTLAIAASVYGGSEGRVFLYARCYGGDFELVGKLHGADNFGESVAVEGSTIVVGHANTCDGAFVFDYDQETGTITELPKVGAGRFAASNDGCMVAIHNATIVVGVPGAKGQPGNAFVFRHNAATGAYDELAHFAGTHSSFGSAVAASDDKVFVAQPASSEVRVYKCGRASCRKLGVIQPTGGIGAELAAYGDTIAVATSNSTFIYECGASAACTEIARFVAPKDDSGFGDALAIHRDTVVVGASTDAPFDVRTGAACVYRLDV